MEHERARWRIPIRALMLLALIAALAAAFLVDRTKRLAAERQAAAEALRAAAEANRAVAEAALAEAERRTAPDEAKGSGRLGE
jgi:hypothetical protein